MADFISNLIKTNPRVAGVYFFVLGLAMLGFNHMISGVASKEAMAIFLIFCPTFILIGLGLLIFPTILYSGAVKPDGRPAPNQIPMAGLMFLGLVVSAILAHFYGLF